MWTQNLVKIRTKCINVDFALALVFVIILKIILKIMLKQKLKSRLLANLTQILFLNDAKTTTRYGKLRLDLIISFLKKFILNSFS